MHIGEENGIEKEAIVIETGKTYFPFRTATVDYN